MSTNPHDYHVGQPVLYQSRKQNTDPGKAVSKVRTEPNGDWLDDNIERYWIVDEVGCDGTLVLRARRGRTLVVQSRDPELRPATRWERFWHRVKFLQPMVP